MDQYKKKIYQKYHTVHSRNLYGDSSIERIKTNYDLWSHYYGFALPENKSSSILEIGCGLGGFVLYLHDKGYKNVTGVDVSEEQIEIGRKLGIKGLIKADLMEYLKDKQHAFDLIIARDVLEHFTRQEVFEICTLAFGALKIEGKFLIQVPNGEGLFSTSIFYGDFTHEWAYTQSSLNQLLKTVGFNTVLSKEIEPFIHGIASWVRWMAWKMIKSWHRMKKAIVTGSAGGIFSPNIICLAEKKE